MIELNPERQHGVFYCRRIIPEDDVDLSTLDRDWVRKLNRGAGGRGDLILRNPRTQIPKGFKLVEEVSDGEVLGNDPYLGQKVHVCNKEKASGFEKGMAVKWVKPKV